MDTAPIMVVMAWLATGGADLLRQERALMRLAAIYGMIVGIREVAQMLGHGGDPTGAVLKERLPRSTMCLTHDPG